MFEYYKSLYYNLTVYFKYPFLIHVKSLKFGGFKRGKIFILDSWFLKSQNSRTLIFIGVISRSEGSSVFLGVTELSDRNMRVTDLVSSGIL